MAKSTISEQQNKFLEEIEVEFRNRYTDNDPEFVKRKNAERKKPPIIDPWYNKPRRPQYDWAKQNQGRRNQNNWDRRYNERERNDRHGGKHHMHQSSRPY